MTLPAQRKPLTVRNHLISTLGATRVLLASRACFDPYHAQYLFHNFAEAKKAAGIDEGHSAISTHPLDKDREGLGPTGRYCLLSGEGPKIADRFKPRSQEDEWHLPHLDDLRERHEARRDYWLEEGLERFAEHRDRITELTDAAHDAHERARWDRDERAHNRAVAMDVFAETAREDWAPARVAALCAGGGMLRRRWRAARPRSPCAAPRGCVLRPHARRHTARALLERVAHLAHVDLGIGRTFLTCLIKRIANLANVDLGVRAVTPA
mgnify:CR=1 FL=1